MTATPPPPPPTSSGEVQEKAPPVAWLIPLAGVLAVIGLVTPWFQPQFTGTVNGRSASADAENSLHAWDDGKIGLLGPIVVIAIAIGVVMLLAGRSVARFERGTAGPVVNAARGAMIAGGVAAVVSIVAWFLLKSQYKFETPQGNKSWDDFLAFARSQGVRDASLSHGPQIGYWLTIAAAALALVGGVLMLVMRQKPQPVAGPPAGAPYGQPPVGGPAGYGPPPAPGQQPQGYGTPPSGYGPPPTAPGQAPSFEKQQSTPGEQPPQQ